MKFLALVSGGKDSIYAALECVKFGHELVCLGNLYPTIEDEQTENGEVVNTEIDSYMFQTVGTEIVPLIAECMQKPIIRKPIKGKSVNQELFYEKAEESKEGDEVEDLYELLAEAKEKYNIEAVSSGAILSDYQRLRVENVCDRLKLISLSYLWQRNQEELLDSMIENGLDARLVKIACIGLKTSFLMQSISMLRDELHRLKDLYQINVWGEGGEFETVVLDWPLFIDKRIKVEKYEIVNISEDEYAPVSHVYISKLGLEDKEEKGGEFDLYEEEEYKDCMCMSSKFGNEYSISILPTENKVSRLQLLYRGNHSFQTQLSWLKAYDNSPCPEIITDEMDSLLSHLEDLLKENGLTFDNVTKIVLYIKKMSTFVNINEVYKKYFKFKPPTRICVGQLWDPGFNIMIELHGYKPADKIKTLHVQSVSYWAPANIGPYSQACQTQNWIHYAGQIGLKPERMTLVHPSSLKQLDQTFINYEQVMKRMSTDWTSVVFCITYFESTTKHKEKMFTKVMDKLPQTPIIFLGVKELPKHAAVELALKSYISSADKKYTTTTKNLELSSVNTMVEHQWLKIEDSECLHLQIDVLSLSFSADEELDAEYFKAVLESLDPVPAEKRQNVVLEVYYEKQLSENGGIDYQVDNADFKENNICEVKNTLMNATDEGVLVNAIPVQVLPDDAVIVLVRTVTYERSKESEE